MAIATLILLIVAIIQQAIAMYLDYKWFSGLSSKIDNKNFIINGQTKQEEPNEESVILMTDKRDEEILGEDE